VLPNIDWWEVLFNVFLGFSFSNPKLSKRKWRQNAMSEVKSYCRSMNDRASAFRPQSSIHPCRSLLLIFDLFSLLLFLRLHSHMPGTRNRTVFWCCVYFLCHRMVWEMVLSTAQLFFGDTCLIVLVKGEFQKWQRFHCPACLKT
jgi:hypothetical protein